MASRQMVPGQHPERGGFYGQCLAIGGFGTGQVAAGLAGAAEAVPALPVRAQGSGPVEMQEGLVHLTLIEQQPAQIPAGIGMLRNGGDGLAVAAQRCRLRPLATEQHAGIVRRIGCTRILLQNPVVEGERIGRAPGGGEAMRLRQQWPGHAATGRRSTCQSAERTGGRPFTVKPGGAASRFTATMLRKNSTGLP